MSKLVFLLEEKSMEIVLENLLPRVLPGVVCQFVSHEGKSDLELSIPRKLMAWKEPGVRFIVVRDNDGADCKQVKKRLLERCDSAGRADTLVRIVCQQLECWYIGDLLAIERAFNLPGLSALGKKQKYRNPDFLNNGSEEFKKLTGSSGKLSAARRIAQYIDPERNLSHSFQVFIAGVKRIAEQGTLNL
ncbi:MAG: DUF4276 family protein [bacterium]